MFLEYLKPLNNLFDLCIVFVGEAKPSSLSNKNHNYTVENENQWKTERKDKLNFNSTENPQILSVGVVLCVGSTEYMSIKLSITLVSPERAVRGLWCDEIRYTQQQFPNGDQ